MKNALIIILALLLFVSVKGCIYQMRLANDIATINKIDRQVIKELETKSGNKVVEQAAIVLNYDKQVRVLSDSLFDFKHRKDIVKVKEVSVYVRAKQVIEPKIPFIHFDSTVNDTANLIGIKIGVPILSSNKMIAAPYSEPQIPKKFSYSDSTTNISGKVSSEGLQIDSLKVVNEIGMRVVEKSKGWFRGKETTVQVINTNKAVSITGMSSVVVKGRKSALDIWVEAVLFGAAGFFFARQLK